MTALIVSSEPVTLVGGGPVDARDLVLARQVAPRLVAADGGADRLAPFGLCPEAVIGDMDSLSAEARDNLADRLHQITEQNSTDFDKALRHVRAPLVLALGVTGGRLDHELAVYSSLLRHPDRPCVLIGTQSLVLLCPAEWALDLPPGSDIGLFPMAELSCDSRGLLWPTAGLRFAPWGQLGTSNTVTEGPVWLRPEAPRMLVILPRAALGAVTQSFVGTDATAQRWPAP